MALLHLIFWPTYVRKMLGIPVATYIWQGWLKISLCTVPFAILSAVVDKYWHPTSLVTFAGQVLVTLPLYVISVVIVFREEAQLAFQKWTASRAIAARI